jgi:hypothetical protein
MNLRPGRLQAIRTSGDVPAPNFVLDTSPGKHQVVWRVEGLDTHQAESLLRALASQYGSDPAATDISRLLRLPGFTNRKYNEAFVVRVHHETDSVYHLQDFHVQEDSPESPRRPGGTGYFDPLRGDGESVFARPKDTQSADSQMKLQMKREALEKLNRRANEMVPTTAADDLMAAPMCTVTVQ